MVKASVLVSVVLISAFLAPTFITNKFGEYQAAMEKFGVNENRAMWMYDETVWAEESKDPESFNNRLQTQGVELWTENLALLNSLSDMPDYLQTRIDLLKKYSALRRDLCEAMKKTAGQPDGNSDKVMQLSEEIGAIITELEALNK